MEMKAMNRSCLCLVGLFWSCAANAQVESDPDEVASLVELLEDDGVPDPRPFRREQLALTRDAGTIVPGAWQLEITAGQFTLRNYQDESLFDDTSITFGEFINLRRGVTADIELQLSVSTYVFEPVAPGSSTLDGEFEFTPQVAAKINLIGNDGGDWAVALRPWIGIGDLTSGFDVDDLALGLDVPATYQLDEERELRMMLTSRLYDKNVDPPLVSGALGLRTQFGETFHGSLGVRFDMNTDPEVRTSGTRLAWVYDWLTDDNTMIDVGVTVGLEQDDGSGDDIAFHVGYSVGF
ncbi:MAG: hypothetical protein EVA77_00725 [Phycisphaeraceae bacterium]|nr:MAG: hypothetical protein EVA77_00725 [Phycisphaeraceae bacterium]